jgi:hypothetical protein
MARTAIEFEYKNEDYKLEFSIDSLKRVEKSGFSFNNIEDHALTAVEDLFYASFNKNHSNTSSRVRKEIYQEFSSQNEDENVALGETLFEMVSETIEAMKPKGNVKWKVTKG